MLDLEQVASAVEEIYGEAVIAEEKCPGVYFFACRKDNYMPLSELVVVERDCPHISDAAKAYGSPLDRHDELLIYDYKAKRGGREPVLYEAFRYLTLHGLPIPDGNTLLSTAVYFSDDYPEYFGLVPAPVMTPHGYTTRYITLSNGIYAVETDTGARLIAIAGFIWSIDLDQGTITLGEKVAGIELPVELTYLFFTEEHGCVALFELLWYPALRENKRLDTAALMNAIWTYHPDYALAYNLWEQSGLNNMFGLILNAVGAEVELSGSAENMIALQESAGVEYVRW